jgi:CheY-like chemotaxis protein
MGSEMRTALFVGTDATERGLIEFARKVANVSLNIIFTRSAEDSIAYLKGDRIFAGRQRYPVPDIIIIDLARHRTHAAELTDWLKNWPQFAHIQLCFVGGEDDDGKIPNVPSHGRRFLSKPAGLMSYIALIHEITDLPVEADASTRT